MHTPKKRIDAANSLLRRKNGFALVLALGLMAFCLLLLLSIGVLTQTELSTSANNKAKTAARMNALLAIQVAMGQLQESAGPDTRVTAPADILDNNNSFPAGNRAWLGVWRTEGAQGPAVYEETENVRLWSQTQGPEWLLSYDPVANPNFSPANELAGETVVLRTIRDDSGVERDVSAGLMSIGDTTDSFAYLVSDHSLLPDALLVPDEDRIAPSPGTVEERLNFMSPARSAIFSRDEFSGADCCDPAIWQDIELISNESYLGLLPSVKAVSSPPAVDSYEGRYSFGSIGLLTDTRRGGLRKDLTRFLMDGQGLADSDSIINRSDYPDLPASAQSRLPKWGIVRDWSRAGSALSGTDGIAPYIQPQSDEQFGLHPLIVGVQVRIGFAYESSEVSPGEDDDIAILQIFPRVELWNPYNVTLPAADYYLRIRAPLIVKPDDRTLLNDEQKFSSPDGTVFQLSSAFNLIEWLLAGQNEPYLEFKVSSPAIEPGLVLPFYIDGNYGSDDYLRGNPDAMPPMVNEAFTDAFVKIDTGLTITPSISASGATDITGITYVELVEGEINALDVELRQAPDSTLLQKIREVRDGWLNTQNGNKLSTWEDSVISEYQPGVSVHEVPAGGLSMHLHTSFWYDDDTSARFSKRIWADLSLRVPEYDRTVAPQENLLLHFISTNNNLINNLDAGLYYQPNLDQDILYTHYLGNRASGDRDFFRYVFYEVPRTGSNGAGVFSLGQFQHLPLALGFWQPAYAMGNSWAPIWVKREEYAGYYTNGSDADRIFDLSYLANESIWDSYFLSAWDGVGVPEDGDFASGVLKIDKEIPDNAAVNDFDGAAEFLVLAGAFNVNSTSVDAWRDLLLAGRDLSATAVNGFSVVPTGETPYSRFTYPYLPASPIDGAHATNNSGNDVGKEENWAGVRSLDMAEIDALAAAIVDEVRARGPFLSLADFINRQLIDDAGADALGRDAAIGLRGALQAAIDSVSQPQDASDVASGGILNAEFNYDSLLVSRKNNNIDSGWTAPEKLTDSDVDQPEHWLGTETGQIGHRMAGIPGFLTQADILSVIGPRLTARGDTFTIYGYGEHKNPLTGDVISARCEAVVRRRAEFVEPLENMPTDATSSLSQLNLSMGRRFEVVSFQWTGN